MGFFDRFRKHTSGFNVSSGSTETNSQYYDTAVLEQESAHENSEHIDHLPSFQTNLVRKISYSDSTTRWLHTKAAPYAHKHTYGVVGALFYHFPYPFKYIKSDTDDVLKAEEDDKMVDLHKQWDGVGMFSSFLEALSQGNGVSASWIVWIDTNFFLVFNTSHIDGDNYWRDPKTREIVEIWFTWHGAQGGYMKGSTKRNSEEIIVKAKIGINAVQYIPNPDTDTTFGRSDLLPIWMTNIYRELNAFYAVLFNKKGGINGRMLVAPDSLGPNAKRVFKKEALKGLESELIEVYYPRGLVSNQIDPSKIVQWIENKGGAPDFPKVNDFLATNSPLPPSFIQGPASGALGGKAPEEDAKTINRFLMSQTMRIQKLVKDINTVFFDKPDTDYMIVPYFREEIDPMAAQQAKVGADGKPLPFVKDVKQEAEQDKQSNTRTFNAVFKRQEIKANAVNAPVTYIGNLWQSGVYAYEEMDFWTGKVNKVYEYLPPEEIEKYVNDPLAVLEGYLDIEHSQMTQVSNNSSIGKIKVLRTEKHNGVTQDVTKIHFKSEWDPKHDEIFLSPIYSVQLEDRGKMYKNEKIMSQTKISLVNASLCSYPRSHLTDLETKAKRQSP